MNEKTIDKDMPELEEQSVVRLEYTSPLLEEYGNLHELTHGAVDGNTSDGLPAGYRITGMPEP